MLKKILISLILTEGEDPDVFVVHGAGGRIWPEVVAWVREEYT